MANDIVQTIAEARVDARSLSEFVFKPAGFKVARRLAPPVDTLQYYINRFNGLNGDFSSSVSVALSSLNNSVAEADGKVAYIETTVQDAINNTAVEGGVLADTFVTVTKNGKGMVARTLRDRNSDTVSVKDFGAVGSGTSLPVSDWYTAGSSNYRGYADLAALQLEYPFVETGNETIDWVATKAGVSYLSVKGGGTLYYPLGTYRFSDEVQLPKDVSVDGNSRSNTVIIGANKTHVGFKLMGTNSSVSNLYIRDMSEGVASDTGRYCKVINCKLSYNKIGLRWYEGYINTVTGNEITFNTCGAVIKGQSYQLNFYDNVVDNNLGGLGILVLGSSGAIIQNNTIEGNRVPSTGHGIGLAAFGVLQRLNIDGNWFEVNGTSQIPSTTTPNPYSCDILINDGLSEDTVELINMCVPEQYRSMCLGYTGMAGACTISNNFHYMSNRAIITRFQSTRFSLQYYGNTFNGRDDRGTKIIDVRYVGGTTYHGTFSVYDNQITVIANSDNRGLLNGINGSFIHCDNETPTAFIKYNGQDLYTKRMSCTEFLALPNATFNVSARKIGGGVATSKRTYKASLGTNGVATRSVSNNGRLTLFPDPFEVGSAYTVIVIAKSGSRFLYYTSSNSPYNRETNVGESLNTFHVRSNVTTGTNLAYLSGGEYYGYCIMLQTEADAIFKGATKLELTDLQIVKDSHTATAAPTSTAVHADVGDIIYNSAPTAGGDFGWVCVTEGAPGVWKSIGTIEA